MNPCELTASITAIANALAGRLTDEELNLLGAALTQLADTLFTIAAQRGLCACSCEQKNGKNTSVGSQEVFLLFIRQRVTCYLAVKPL